MTRPRSIGDRDRRSASACCSCCASSSSRVRRGRAVRARRRARRGRVASRPRADRAAQPLGECGRDRPHHGDRVHRGVVAHPGSAGFELSNIPVEPIALIVLIALLPLAAYVATARDVPAVRGRRDGRHGRLVRALVPEHRRRCHCRRRCRNAYQGFLPTYLYPFQFRVHPRSTEPPAPIAVRGSSPAADARIALTGVWPSIVGYAPGSWRIALAEQRRDRDSPIPRHRGPGREPGEGAESADRRRAEPSRSLGAG